MKTYQYDKRSFFIEVKFTGYFCIAVIITCAYLALTGVTPGLMVMGIVIASYTVWNTFISHSTPETVSISEEGITFSSFGKVDHYARKDLKKLRIREFPSSGKMYIRINDGGMIKGRYWVQTRQFENGKELFHALLDMEYGMHPDTLKARARRVNTEYMEAGVSTRGTGKKRKRKVIRVEK